MQDNTLMETIRGQLRELADPEYREFHSRLLPGITGIMGVRTPQLRGLSKQLIKDGWQEYIKQVSLAWKQTGQGEKGVYYDEMILWGLCICGGFKDWDRALPYIEEFVPAINNWAVCHLLQFPESGREIQAGILGIYPPLSPVGQGVRDPVRGGHDAVPFCG